MPFSCLGYQYEIQYSPVERKHSLSLLDDELCSSSSSPLGNLTHSVARLGRAEAGPLLSVKRRALEKMPASVWPLAHVLYLPQTNQTTTTTNPSRTTGPLPKPCDGPTDSHQSRSWQIQQGQHCRPPECDQGRQVTLAVLGCRLWGHTELDTTEAT